MDISQSIGSWAPDMSAASSTTFQLVPSSRRSALGYSGASGAPSHFVTPMFSSTSAAGSVGNGRVSDVLAGAAERMAPRASTARIRAESGARLVEFQRNAAYVAFMCVVVVFCVLQMVSNLRSALIPLVWASFFALPLQRAVDYLNLLEIQAMSSVLQLFRSRRRETVEEVVFWHTPGLNSVSVDNSPENAALLEKINNPFADTLGRCPRRRVARPRSGFTFNVALRCCRRRVRVTYLEKGAAEAPGTEAVNRLQVDACFHIGEPEVSDDGTSLILKFFLDADQEYPAIIDEEDAAVHRPELRGTFDVDKTSQISWMVAICLVLLMVFSAVMGFVSLVYRGAVSLQDNLDSYVTGVTDMISYLVVRTERFIPPERWDQVRADVVAFLTENLPTLAEEVLTIVSETLMQAVLFTIYLLFWLSEPLPVSPSISGVFKSYLFLKTGICLLFAALMSALLAGLSCNIWPLFFVITFLLNYIPEIGSIMVGLLAVPAVLFDGSVADVETRLSNTFTLAVMGSMIKFLTGNVIEVQLYASRGGELMRMHPVVLLATMLIFGATLGITGMFLSVPIVAAVKYHLVSANVPASILNPLLVFIEGDDTAPHRNFVDKWRAQQEVKRLEDDKRSFITSRSGTGDGSRSLSAPGGQESPLAGAAPLLQPQRGAEGFSASPWTDAISAARAEAIDLEEAVGGASAAGARTSSSSNSAARAFAPSPTRPILKRTSIQEDGGPRTM